MLNEVLEFVHLEILLAVGILLFILLTGKEEWKRTGKLPPGPRGLPIFGYLPFMTRNPHIKFIELAKKYGNVFSIHLGFKYVVVLNDVESIREAFGKPEFLGRPPDTPLGLFGLRTPFFSDDMVTWHEQRRFVVRSMKDLGMGNSKLEGHIQDEIRYFLNVLKESNGRPMNLMKPLTPSMSNNICSLVFGRRYDYENPVRRVLDHGVENVGDITSQKAIHLYLPWLKHFPFLLRLNYKEGMNSLKKIFSIIEENIRMHKQTLEENNIRDFIDIYLLEKQSRNEMNPETTFCDETLKGCIMNLFMAGTETVRMNIAWCMYIVAAFPDIQMKVHEEINDVIGSSTHASILDQKNMPYTQAVIREVMRWKTLIPLNLLRYTLDNTEVAGYKIPKGTIVMANFWSVHHDPRYWKDPETFRPERFLDSNGMLIKSSSFIPFSIGKRACPGETMAMMEIFLYFVSILQKFQVTFPAGFKPSFDAELSLTFRLKPHKICFSLK